MKTSSQPFIVIMLSVLLLTSCSQKREFVIEHKWQVEKIQKYSEAIYEKFAHRFKEKGIDKDSSDATKDIIELFALPLMIETLDEVGIMEFTGTFLILYDKKGNLMQKINYTVVNTSENNKKIIEIEKEKYEFIKMGENNAIFKTSFADFYLRL